MTLQAQQSHSKILVSMQYAQEVLLVLGPVTVMVIILLLMMTEGIPVQFWNKNFTSSLSSVLVFATQFRPEKTYADSPAGVFPFSPLSSNIRISGNIDFTSGPLV